MTPKPAKEEPNLMGDYNTLRSLYDRDPRLMSLQSTLDLAAQYDYHYPTALLLAYRFILEPDEEKAAAAKKLCNSVLYQIRKRNISIPPTIQEKIAQIIEKAKETNKPGSLEEVTIDDYVPMYPNLDSTEPATLQ